MLRRTLLKGLSLVAGSRFSFRLSSRLSSLESLSPPADLPVSDAAQGPEIFANQLGYRPGDVKVATVRGAAPGQATFRVRNAADNKVVFDGHLGAPMTDRASGDRVQMADFSAVKQPGTYRLEVAGQGTGPFRISNDVYAEALRTVMRAFTGQRCGCAVDLGNGYRHAACHGNGSYGASTGKTGQLPNHGGWHDAGDYGRYIVNSAITCGTLLWAWELYTPKLRDLRLDIPKQHAGLPDYLEEILWNLNWMLQLQDADGGVFHKQTSDHFCGFIMPEADSLPSHVIGTGSAPYKSTAATADFAAVMAMAARCYRPFDQGLAAQFLVAARRAWVWAKANPAVAFKNPAGVTTGEYGDAQLSDEFLWASAELWRTAGEDVYKEAFLQSFPAKGEDLQLEVPAWDQVRGLAYLSYALAPPEIDTEARGVIRRKARDVARTLMERSAANGYGNTLAQEDYIWGSNGVAGNQSMLLAVTCRLNGDREAAQAAMANLHYFLGRNCFGVSWVTQVGTRPFMHPHHRPSAADNIVAPWPGLLSGGPNRRPGDEVARRLPAAPPMRMWVDDTGAYSMNEVAINWNAPLVLLLALADSGIGQN